MHVSHIYIPMQRSYNTNLGLAERQLRRRLEKQGWLVWRAGSLQLLRRDDLYPTVRKKYMILERLMEKHHLDIETLQYFSEVHHGMPDFFCYKYGQFKFVECKFGYEQLSALQKICIIKLQQLGYLVEVHILCFGSMRTRRALIDFETGEKKIVDKQMSLMKFMRKAQEI